GRAQAQAGRRHPGAPRGRERGPLGAPRLQRRRGPRPEQGGARLLRPRADLEGLPGHPAARGGPYRQPGRQPGGERRRTLSAAKRLVLWRHGQTTWNLEHRFQGQTDIPLDPTGEAQAEQAARRLATLRPHALFSSDLSRAQQTAAPLARLTGLPVTLDKDLRERFGGDWEGLA